VLICHCFGVNETRIRELARGGRASLLQVLRSCRAGADCGGCHPAIRQILAAERERCAAGDAYGADAPEFEPSPQAAGGDRPAA